MATPERLYAEEWDNPRWRTLVRKARRTNAQRDQDERTSGFAAPGDCTVAHELRTAMLAVSCGLGAEDWDAVAEGFVMLQHVEMRMRAADQGEGE